MGMRFLALIGVLLAAPQQQPPDERPNVVFILIDDHRPDAMGCYGNDVVRTPNFDQLAMEGARLDCFIVAAPLCCPSRAAYLTGLYPHQNGVTTHDGADPRSKTPTIAETLAKAGYATGFVGKAHLGGDPRKWGFKDAPLWLTTGPAPRLMADGVEKKVDGSVAQALADAAIAWLGRRGRERFFLWLAVTGRSDPAHAYKRADIKPPPLWPKNEPLSNADWTGYYSTISAVDEQIGRVLKKMRDDGLIDKTFVFVAGDNGLMHGSHGYPAKSVWFEESARVPALARWPSRVGVKIAVPTPVASVDLYPTLCELAGAAKPEGLEGVSMMKALALESGGRTVAYSEVTPKRGEGVPWQMVRNDRWKYVKTEDGKEYLYDLAVDPGEQRSVGNGRQLERMRALHKNWLEATPAR
jgi:arylsulfatase A-like enzyme